MNTPRIDTLKDVFTRHRARLLLTLLLLWTTMLAGTALLGLSGGFLTAAALAGAAGLGSGFNFFSPSAGIRGLTMARIVSRYFEKLVGHDVTLRIARDLRVWFFRRALPLAPARLAGIRTGELLARLMSDIGEVDGLLVRAIGPLLALAGISVVAVVSAGIIYPPAAALLAVLALLIGIGVPWLTVRGAGEQERDRALHRAQLRTQSFEGLEGAADLAALQAGEHWNQRVLVAAKQLKSRDRRRRWRLIRGNALHGLCAAAGLVAMLWLALHGFQQGAIDAALAAALVFLTVALLELWAGIGLAWQSWLSGRVAAVRLETIVDQAPGVAEPTDPVALPAQAATLSFDNVAFRWPGQARALLQDVQLELQPGERIAIGGDSGSGKTTLSALLLRLWDPDAGRVRYGGIDIAHLAQDHWHRQIAWLPQNAPVFAGSIADNLRLGDPDAGDARLWQVLADVRLQGWAEQLGGLQAWVGENGATMSAGQARRLALARALLRDAPILLLDEPTEGLDVDTAHALLHDMVAALGGRSLLMITHDALPEGIVHRSYRLREGRLG
ncbi:thiol reductant ABC exporter subunit CydC [Stenotrophomonas rhizophila]|uniref:thiol reductant ABC exporter subunit CydC n=1 Tax=Stenotrophomonas rhizophila TaxID=216778 RepID=UPI001E2DF6AA|nr:thiol reductant ABC exporter subunit CydC [Stenotrophomonas rhizophila]MCC7635169.1 thiol reductant ABC exporter subunit CydC [Stenotrophomonas rhizophila]MCC7664616.1 thiol reductant ABC exporter subunit CydC [Stenotrophomonas rhizophila]